MQRNILFVLVLTFAFSFILPSAEAVSLFDCADSSYMPGYECAFAVMGGFVDEWQDGDFSGVLFNFFLFLPNLIVFPIYFFHNKLHGSILIFSLVIVTLSCGYWLFLEFGFLKIGYYIWFLSCLGITIVALPFDWDYYRDKS